MVKLTDIELSSHWEIDVEPGGETLPGSQETGVVELTGQ
jgi:hypothetical protein